MLKPLRSRLQFKLMLGFSLVLLAPLSITTSFTQLRVRDILISRARDEQMRLAGTRVDLAAHLLTDIGTDLLFLTQSPPLERYVQGEDKQVDHDAVAEILLGVLARSGQRYTQICVTDQTDHALLCARMVAGRPVLASTDTPIVSAIPHSATAPLERLQDRPMVHILELLPQSAAGTPTAALRYSAALRDESGRSAGQLTLDVAAKPIIDLLVDSASTTRTIIVDHTGAYVFGSPGGTLSRDRPATAAQILGRPGGTIIGTSDALDTFTAFYQLTFPDQDMLPWTVIYDQPLALILGPIDQTLLINIAIAFTLLLAGLIVAYVLTYSIVRPLRALAAAAARVGAGDLNTPFTRDMGDSRDEIGALARTFERTVAQLRSTLDSAEARRREAETLYTTATALSSTLDLHRLLDRILDELRTVVPYDSSTVQLVRGDQIEIIGAYGLARPEKLIGTCFSLTGSGPNAEVARLRTTLIIDDAPAVYARFNEEPYHADPIRSWLGVPLIFGERLIGMITIDKYEPGFYTPGHARLASAFAAQAAIALENARLYEAVRDELAERRRSEQAQVRAEEQLRQAQKMEAVGRLAGGVSHDFNNILTVIMGESDLLLHGAGMSGELRQGLERIRHAGARAAALTRQLLAFSSRQVLQLTTVNLNEIIAPIELMLHRLIGEDVILRTQLSNDLAPVRADASQIEQVILNLCINGRDAMPHGGTLCIATANAQIGPGDDRDLAPGHYVLLTVSDTGLGIDEDARDHIFEPFFTTKPRDKGTGLGLATVHGIVQQSGGVIRFSSLSGQGTSFLVYLPALLGPHSVMPLLAPVFIPKPINAGSVVMLVEDDDRVRRLTSDILSAQGFTVMKAADGAEALRICAAYEGTINLLLSDIVMPGGINGVQLASRIRATRAQIKVLLMSGYTDNALSSSGGITPDMHFIQKPFTPAYLLEKIYEALAITA